MNTTVLLIVLVLINVLVLIAIVIWNILFKGSFRKMIMTFIGMLIENTSEDHYDEAIEMDNSERQADVMVQKAQSIQFEDAVAQMRPRQLEQAFIPAGERGELARETSDNGWPRTLDKETRHESRPFLDVHLRTETVPNPADEEEAADTSSDT